MNVVFTGSLDDVAVALAAAMKRAADASPLTDDEKELYHEAFRAGATMMYYLSLDASTQGIKCWESMMLCVAAQVTAWDLPLIGAFQDSTQSGTVQ